jgi:hypothetical protein
VSRQRWRRHLLYARNSRDAAANATELSVPGSVSTLEHVHNGADDAVAVLDEFAFSGKVQRLEKQTKASLHEHLISVETEREAQLTLVEELDDLDDVFACIANGYNG